jgi:hypothetical protein
MGSNSERGRHISAANKIEVRHDVVTEQIWIRTGVGKAATIEIIRKVVDKKHE